MGGGCYRSQLSSSWQSPEASVDGGDRRGTEERWERRQTHLPPKVPNSSLNSLRQKCSAL